MNRVAFALRMDAGDHAALENLSELEGRPINQLLIETITAYLTRAGRKEQRLEKNLARLKAYRERDPGFREAIAFVESEGRWRIRSRDIRYRGRQTSKVLCKASFAS